MTPSLKYKCPECGMPKSEWTRNNGMGFEREGLWYCCQGCAQDNRCTCKNDPRPLKHKRRDLKPRSLAGHRLAGREPNPIVVE